MTTFPGDCAECEKPLNSYAIKYGWMTISVGWGVPPARVHTICRSKFNARPFEQKRDRARAQRITS